jgi:hypothetical protein
VGPRTGLDAVIKVKVKVVPVLFLTDHQVMKAYCGVEIQFCALLTSALDGGEWSASRLGLFIPRAGLDAVVKEKKSQPLPGFEPLIIQSVA